jgi:hypothetical protein
MNYGERLAKAMKRGEDGEVEIKDLARECGLSVQRIGQILDPAYPDRQMMAEPHAKAAKYLRVNPFWLATGSGPRAYTPSAGQWPFELVAQEDWEKLPEKSRGMLESEFSRLFKAEQERLSKRLSPEHGQRAVA